MVDGAYLCAEDATFAGKASKKMLGVQKWEDHSGNPDSCGYLFDAYFANASFIKPQMEKGTAVILRLRKNAVGWDDPLVYSGRRRPRKRGKKWKLADLLKKSKTNEYVLIFCEAKKKR